MQVLALLACLAAADGQFGVTGPNAGELLGDTFRGEMFDDVYERTAGTDWWELAWITDENEAMNALNRLDQRGKHFFGQHGSLINDDRTCASLGWSARKVIADPVVPS